MSFRPFTRFPLFRRLLRALAQWRVREKLGELTPYFLPSDNMLDIGSGNGVLCGELRARGYRVTALDVDNLSFIDSIKPVVYDGVTMPFANNAFDVALLITVLHHTRDPDQVLAEANRVAGRVVVIEEIYSNALNKYMTYFIDSLFNFEFFGHPRSNRTDDGWREAFRRIGFTVAAARYSRSVVVLHRVTYVLEGTGRSLGASDSFERMPVPPAG